MAISLSAVLSITINTLLVVGISQDHSKVFTTGQARFNPEQYVSSAWMAEKFSNAHMACLSLAVCCSKSIKPTYHSSTHFIT